MHLNDIERQAMHYYSHNIADYRKDTGHLTPVEHFIYRSLIDWYYLDEKPIPLETQTVMRRLSLGPEMLPDLDNILTDFFTEADDGYHQKRIDMEIREYNLKAVVNRANGKLGGRPKKTQSVNSGNPNETEGKGNHKPLTINHKPLTIVKTKAAINDGFDIFWNSYPKKIGKDKARGLWKSKKPNLDEALKAISWQVNSKSWQDGFIPNPATYLSQGRWKDEKPAEGMPF